MQRTTCTKERPADEAALIRAAQAGSQEAFAELVRRHYSLGLRTAAAVLGNRHDAEDALQDALLKAFRYIRTFDGRSAFSTWLYRIVYNACVDQMRKNSSQRRIRMLSLERMRERRDLDLSRVVAEAALQSWWEQAVRQEQAAILERAIASLPRRDTELVKLRYGQGLSVALIARRLGIPENTVKTRLHRIRQQLRELITAEMQRASVA